MISERPSLSQTDHAQRYAQVSEACRESSVDAWLFTDLTDVRWLTGFVGSNGWAVVRGDELFVGTDGRYGDKAREETAQSGAIVIVEQQASLLHRRLGDLLAGAKVGLDGSTVSNAMWQRLAEAIEVEHHASPVKVARQTKDGAELARIERAASIADEALLQVEPMLLATVDEPMTELDVRAELEYRMILHGADDRSYDTIVASGPDHGARPHHGASRRTIVEGDTVIIDVGALVDGYHSDMTRSWVIGEATAQQREIYELVAASQRAGVAATHSGVDARAIDTACREVFEAAGYLDWYLHGTGHGVGLDIHEIPFHSQSSTDKVMADYVVTVEPGLYRGGFGGFRIEDLVHVTDAGSRVLTHAPKRELT